MLARFTSADTITESPYSTQGWNRYSYVGNDPLAFTDPSGHCFLGCFWQHVGSAIKQVFSNTIVRAIAQIAITVAMIAVLGPGGALASLGLTVAQAGVAAAAVAAATVTGLSGGNLGQILKAGAIAGLTAFAFNAVGDWTPGAAHAMGSADFDPAAYAENIAGHALVGCASSAASGGSCQSGALSGGVTAGAGPLINGQSFGAALVENTVVGGLASVAGGGKFANGAVTGAFGYLFNFVAHIHRDLTYASARAAGLSIDQALTLGKDVANVDGWPGSQDPENSFMHAMRAPELAGDDAAAAQAIEDYKSRLWAMNSVNGLAGLLHESQDSYSEAHAGMQVWYGMTHIYPWDGVMHYISDQTGVSTIYNASKTEGTKLILDYDRSCGGCIKNMK